MISLLIAVIIFGLIYYCITLLPLPAVIKTVALVVLVVIAIVYLLGFLPGVAGGRLLK